MPRPDSPHLAPSALTDQYIILEHYTPAPKGEGYQSERALEDELIDDLKAQGYVHRKDIRSAAALLANVKDKLEALNALTFNADEWGRFVREYLDAPQEGVLEKTNKVHNDAVYDFAFDDGTRKNIYLFDKDAIHKNTLEVINQYEAQGKTFKNRYDVTLLINGLPLVHIELKRRGVRLREAFSQVARYQNESFSTPHSLFRFVQIFVISNGTDTRYFANTISVQKSAYVFAMHWARADNVPIKDLKDFAVTFFEPRTVQRVLFTYSVFNAASELILMRPYQIAATERLLWRINASYQSGVHSSPQAGGFIWHTTGSGKTLTSFKAARLASDLSFIDKVLFVVDRKDLDAQTIAEYKKLDASSVSGSVNTSALRARLESADARIIVTTIQKLGHLMKQSKPLSAYKKRVVFVFDECHRSQFGLVQATLQKTFKHYYQFGFTGTPIFKKNAGPDGKTTADVFGALLHSYMITDALRDGKVLGFKVDYHSVTSIFKNAEQPKKSEDTQEDKALLHHPKRIELISQYILDKYPQKTRRNNTTGRGFNALFATDSVTAAKMYYTTLKRLQEDAKKPLKIAIIFSFGANEERPTAYGLDEANADTAATNISDKAFLQQAIEDYNRLFGENHSLGHTGGFDTYYRALAKRVKDTDVDLLIVVGMFLTGFDAPNLNTLFVDKSLRYHGLIQAYSRTNRITHHSQEQKPVGNVITFRDLSWATLDALALFGNKARQVILETSFTEQMQGAGKNKDTGQTTLGLIDIVKNLNEKFSQESSLDTLNAKREFIELFGEYLKADNILRHYDEYIALKEYQHIDPNDANALDAWAQSHHLDEDKIAHIQQLPPLPSMRQIQDWRSIYSDLYDEMRASPKNKQSPKEGLDEVVFEMALFKSHEINLDFILNLMVQQAQNAKTKEDVIDTLREVTRTSPENRAKEGLFVDFVNQADMQILKDANRAADAFYAFARQEKQEGIKTFVSQDAIADKDAAKNVLEEVIRAGYVSEYGNHLAPFLPLGISKLSCEYKQAKREMETRLKGLVQKFRGI